LLLTSIMSLVNINSKYFGAAVDIKYKKRNYHLVSFCGCV
jgi:hypothetical protein